ncbi:MAG: hypothetical protein KAR19_11275 [Bacteroidales bacterium]|nr:hypothetical protein [Bacteroidales bacterium]
MKKYIITFSILFSALALSAQDVIWKMTYDVGIPFSSTKEYADQVSWRGIALDFDRFINDNLAVGIGISWNLFLEKESDSYYERDDALIHGTQVRYINNIPLLARVSWYQPLDLFDAYFSAGGGAVWQESRREIGTWAFTGTYWQFALSPEAGLVFPIGQSYLTAKVRYVHGFKTSDAPTLSYLGFGVGFAW